MIPLDATEVQNSTFPCTPNWSSLVEFGIIGYYDSGRLSLAGSQDTDLSCHVPISTFSCITRSQSINVTGGRTDGRTDVRLVAQAGHVYYVAACSAKTARDLSCVVPVPVDNFNGPDRKLARCR